jgi:hypothetical protein
MLDGKHTEAELTNVPAAQQYAAPINQFNTPSHPTTPSFTAIPGVPNGVLNSSAWLDLSKEPIVFTMPDTGGVYNMMAILSGWTNVFKAPGARTTGTGAQNYVIVGPEWTGRIPAGLKRLNSPTDMVWIEGQTQYNGPSSLAQVQAIQAGYKLTPLSSWGKPYTPPSNVPTNSNVDTSKTPQNQVQHMSPQTFFADLNAYMASNPPSARDAPVLAQMARIGIAPGKPFNWSSFSSAMQHKIQRGVTAGHHEVTKLGLKAPGGEKKSGWIVNLHYGNYGTNYALRASAAFSAYGAVRPADDTYYVVAGSGKHDYTITFPKGQQPPTNGFWELDMYNTKLNAVSNPINRYAIGPHLGALHANADGSVTIYVQNAQPSTSQEQQNWLPAPSNGFLIVLHDWWPKAPVTNGTWSPPALSKTS